MPSRSPFTPEQEKWIVPTFAQLQSLTKVKRKFRIVFKILPKYIPNERQFKNVIERFEKTGTCPPE